MADPVVRPLKPDRWDDLVDLFGPERGASSGCWCMWHRVTGRPAWNALGAEGRKAAFRAVVEAGPAPGLLAYVDDVAIGWVAITRRGDLPRFNTQKVSRRPDTSNGEGGQDAETDSTHVISCFFIRPGFRRRGLMRILATAAIEEARQRGARAVEACPIEQDKPLMWGEGFVGIAPLFRDLGFAEIARRSPRRPLMRLEMEASA